MIPIDCKATNFSLHLYNYFTGCYTGESVCFNVSKIVAFKTRSCFFCILKMSAPTFAYMGCVVCCVEVRFIWVASLIWYVHGTACTEWNSAFNLWWHSCTVEDVFGSFLHFSTYAQMGAMNELEHYWLHSLWNDYLLTFKEDSTNERYLITGCPKWLSIGLGLLICHLAIHLCKVSADLVRLSISSQ